ncbi:hypothetical protein Tco_0508522 [Tanacetum coccineum]
MEQMTSICDMVSQIMQKKEEERRIAEDQVAKDRYWKIPICYDDDEDSTIAITPVLSTKEPVDSLIMEDEHLDIIPVTESDKVIKSSIENLVQIPTNIFVILSDSNNDGTSSDDDSYENIEYVEASLLNLEIVSLEEVNEDQEEKEFNLEDILQIQDVILCEKLLNISRLITNIESLKDNPTPDRVLKSPSSFPIPIMDSDSFFEESDTSLSHLDNSLPKFETFSDHTEQTKSGSTITHANNSLPEYNSFLFEIEPDQGGLTGIVISDNSNDPLLELPEFESFHFDLYNDPLFPRLPPEPPNVEISLIVKTDAPVINNFDELNEDECYDPGGDEIDVEDDDSFTFVIWTFLRFSLTLRFLLYLPPPGVKKLFLTPASPLRADGISSGWNFHAKRSRYSRRTKNNRVKYEWDAKQGLVGNLKSSCTDIAKISRKRSKPDKHGHGNGIECAKAGRMLSKAKTKDKEEQARDLEPSFSGYK